MKTFYLYKNLTRQPAIVAVKKGFSWSAFLIGPLWFLLNGMWLTFLLSVSFTWGAPLLIRAFESPTSLSNAIVQLLVIGAFFAIWFFTGIVANFLLGEELKHKGYELLGSAQAMSTGEAVDTVRAHQPNPSFKQTPGGAA